MAAPEPTAPAGPSGPYWEGAREGSLVLQRCVACGVIRHYPQPLCPQCHSFEVDHVRASGQGEVYSWTVTHHPFDPSVADEVPYVLVTVDLVEGVRVLGRMEPGVTPRVGLPVSVRFRAFPGGLPLLEVTAARGGAPTTEGPAAAGDSA